MSKQNWIYIGKRNYRHLIQIGPTTFCDLKTHVMDDNILKGWALLISAAPDLVEALEEVEPLIDTKTELYKKVIAAIRKARGVA